MMPPSAMNCSAVSTSDQAWPERRVTHEYLPFIQSPSVTCVSHMQEVQYRSPISILLTSDNAVDLGQAC